MVDYTEFVRAATEMLAEYGVPVVVTSAVGTPDYDATRGEPESLPPRQSQTVGVRVDYRLGEIDGTRILSTDARLYLSAEGISKPMPGDSLDVAGEKLKVMDCKPLQPAGVVVLYEVQARK